MRANSPSAFFASLLLHAVVAGLLIGLSLYIAQVQSQQRPPVIFDLVAGPPTDPDATEAPALGNTFEIPKSAPAKAPEPVRQPEPEPVVQTVKTPPVEEVIPTPPKETPKPKPQPKVKEPPKPKPTLTKEAKKVVDQMNNKRIVSYLNEKKKIDREAAKREAERKAREAREAAKYKPVDVQGIAGGVVGGSTKSKGGQGGKALTAEEIDRMNAYAGTLKNALKEKFDELKPTGLADTLTADVTFLVAANGEIGNVRIARSSGNAEFDDAVLQTFRRVVWAKRRPDGQTDTWKLTFRMRDLD